MSNSVFSPVRLHHLLLAPIVVLGLASIIATGGGGSVNGGGVRAFNFNPTNMEDAAEFAVAAPGLFPGFTDMALAMIDVLWSGVLVSNTPFDIGMCASGTSTLTWNDVDFSGDFNTGDSASLSLVACDLGGEGDIVNGSVDLAFTTVALTSLPKSVATSVNLNVEIMEFGSGDTIGFSGQYDMQVDTADDNNFSVTYSGQDPGGLIAGSLNGVTLFRYGCFSIAHDFSINVPDTFTLEVSGVLNVDDKIMSLEAGSSLGFVPYQGGGSYLDTGQQRLLSTSSPHCAAVDVPNGVTDSMGVYIDLIAEGGGDVRLELYDSSDALLHTINTTWDALD